MSITNNKNIPKP